jgi:hypothetical protein
MPSGLELGCDIPERPASMRAIAAARVRAGLNGIVIGGLSEKEWLHKLQPEDFRGLTPQSR